MAKTRVETSTLSSWTCASLLMLALSLSVVSVMAQSACVNPKYPGSFTIDKTKICAGTQINVINTSSTINNVGYNYNYDGKTALGSFTTTTGTRSPVYTNPGSYTIIQVGSGNGAGTGTILCKEVTVLGIDPIKFTVNTCSGRRATIIPEQSSLGQYDRYEIYWGDGVREQKTRAEMAGELSHTYSNAGNVSYTLTVQGIYNPPADCRSTLQSSAPITFNSTTKPVIQALKATSDNTIEIDYQAGAGIAVQLYQKVNGSYAPTGQSGTSAGTFRVQSDASQIQCFQLVTQDVCTGLGVSSDEVCSMVLDVKTANKQNDLSWQPYSGPSANFSNYQVRRNGVVVSGKLTNRASSTYTDANDINCGVQYCYTLEASVGPTTISTAPFCVTGINTNAPGDLEGVLVTIDNNHPYLITSLPVTATPSTYTLAISRSTGGTSGFQQIATVSDQNTFIDETADASANSYCYQVNYVSACGLASKPTPPVCTVWLRSDSPKGLDWSAASPFTPQTLAYYIVEVIDTASNTSREINLGLNTHFDLTDADLESQTQRYKITAVSDDGTISWSNFFTFRREASLWIPDAFTPDNDANGMNETFVVKGTYLDQFRMTIYDRWGEVIYDTTDRAKGWDGRVKGDIGAKGQYMYRVEVTDSTGKKTVRTGAVLLIR